MASQFTSYMWHVIDYTVVPRCRCITVATHLIHGDATEKLLWSSVFPKARQTRNLRAQILKTEAAPLI